MSKTVAISVTCSCKEQKKFKYTAQKAGKLDSTKAVSVQVECPFTYEANCVKHLSIQLPPGIQLNNDENILRG